MSSPSLHTAHRPPLSLDRPRIMGILNVTPDSFSNAQQFLDHDAAVARGLAMAEQGASIIDIGGESTRPGSQRTDARTQLERVLPVIQRLRAALDQQHPHVWISIDTTRAEVTHAALDAGADLVNDIAAGTDDPEVFAVAARADVPIVLMHKQGEPATMQERPQYDDVLGEVRGFLLQQVRRAEDAGVQQVVLDPGIGFGKTLEHNLTLLGQLDALVATGYPVLLGTSRKGMIRELSPTTTQTPDDRAAGTCATTALAVAQGVRLFRVHDVRENLQAAQVAHAIVASGQD